MKASPALCLLFLTAAFIRDDLSYSDFQKLHETLIPKAQEKWQSIPWKIDLLQARDLAAGSGKPLFMWSMNGHPLGCG